MFGNTYELRSLYDTKSDQIRGTLNVADGLGDSGSTESTFLGPVLWDDTYMINDLDNINLAEFSPTVLHESIEVNQSWDDVFPPNQKDQEQITCFSLPETSNESQSSSEKDITLDPSGSIAQSHKASPSASLSKAPITRKASRVPLEQKNEKYWNRRMKNNASAKRSRDARRMMENQVHEKAAMLEQENAQMRRELDRLALENKTLRELLATTTPYLVPQDMTEVKSFKLSPVQSKFSTADNAVNSSCSPYRFIQPQRSKI